MMESGDLFECREDEEEKEGDVCANIRNQNFEVAKNMAMIWPLSRELLRIYETA